MSSSQRRPFPVFTLAAALAVLIGALVYVRPPVIPGEDSAAVEADPAGPDMLVVFRDGPEGKRHASEFAAICSHAARALEVDAQRGDRSRIKSGLDLAEYRNDLRYYTTEGWSFSSQYPRLKDTVAAYLDAAAGNDPQEMTPATREAWVKALLVLSRNSLYASEHL